MTEHITLMEPMMPSFSRNDALEDLAGQLIAKANRLAGMTHQTVEQSIGELVRSMNCYYSNLIEDHNTGPRDIERAMAEDYATDTETRNLQLEARAHIEVQQMIDQEDGLPKIVSADYISWIHHEFYTRLPEELLWLENPDTGERHEVIPGKWRDTDVAVGRHIPILAKNIDKFLARFEDAYDPSKLPMPKQVIAVAAAHHRLLWIHPFLDGNGRVTRLLSHAYFKKIGVGSSLWSVSRGLARNVKTYKELLEAADGTRQGDLDGRGSLSEKSLVEFCTFFLKVCLDQVKFMDSLLIPNELAARVERYCVDEVRVKNLPQGSFLLLREVLYQGDLDRGRVKEVTGYEERQARTIMTKLMDKGLLVSDTPRGKLRLGFPSAIYDAWFPNLFVGVI